MKKLAEQIVKSINTTTNDYDAVEEADKIINLYLNSGKDLIEVDKILKEKFKKHNLEKS
tara:strand:- start:350 stop:526 length:177 start_codon:yes stop_codon:yes gene_type:complete